MSDQAPGGRSPFLHELDDGRVVATGRPRASVRDDPRTMTRFRLANFVDRSNLPTLLDRVLPPDGFVPRMFRNDQMGDCTIVGEANYATLAAVRAGDVAVPQISDDDVQARYSRLTGYNPAAAPDANGHNPTDRGAVETEVLNDWRHDPFAGVTLLAYATIDVSDVELLRYAIQIFGGFYAGVALPNSAKGQTGPGRVWDTVPGLIPNSWGGHCVVTDGFDWTLPVPELLHATWAMQQRSTEGFWRACGDEAYAPVLSIHQQDPTPAIKWDLLNQYLAELGTLASG